MAIIGAHMLFHTPEAEALRALLRDAFNLDSVDAGGGWLIFKLPPSELGVHPADSSQAHHEISFMCDDIHATIGQLRAKGVKLEGEPKKQGFGTTVSMTLPGGLSVLLYE